MAGATMVPGYRHVPGNHCGSTAIRNLLGFHGVEISEEMALGLGAGACFYYVAMERVLVSDASRESESAPLVRDGVSPSRFTNGRTSRLEEEFVELTGAPLGLRRFPDADASWAAARESVEDGRPALLLTDLYYLDHYGRSAHFPGHAVVLAGFDDEVAYLSDTGFADLQTTTLASLRDARHAQHPVFPLAGHMFVAVDGIRSFDPRAAAPVAIARAAARMLEPPLGEYEGLPALRRFASEVGSWPEAVGDWQWCARFAYQTIERRGTGGGNFRAMYSRFLDEAGSPHVALAATASERWTALAAELQTASEESEPSAERWSAVSEAAAAVLEAEERLWPALASRSGSQSADPENPIA